jgi:hypothetical protein
MFADRQEFSPQGILQLARIRDAIESLIESEKQWYAYLEQEMNKFTQGFAYGRPEGNTTSGNKPKVHGVERKGNGRQRKKDPSASRNVPKIDKSRKKRRI